MRLFTMLKERVAIWWAIFARPWVYVVYAAYGVVGFLDSSVPKFSRAELLPVKYHCLWDRYYVMPGFTWQTSTVVFLATSVVILLEGSYRLIKRRDTEYIAAVDSFRSELLEVTQRLDTHPRFQEQKAQLAQIIHNLRTSIAEFLGETSEDKRAALMTMQNSAAAWLHENIGTAEAQAFVAANPCLALPANLRGIENAGTYQEACGRLSFLVGLVSTLGRN